MKQTSTRQRLKIAAMKIALAFIAIAVVWSILQGYAASWTGFGDFTAPDGEFVRGKTLWDWMELLVIPLALAIGAFFLNRSERAVEREIAENRTKLEREIAMDRQREAALQSYLDRMAELLLKENLRAPEDEEVRKVARIRTLTVLRGLDAKRKGMVLLFLHESGLINKQPVISLTGADLRGDDLSGANLRQANLSEVNLNGADLRDANLYEADLGGTDLREANLSNASLNSARLVSARLFGANLSEASLFGADLCDADLRSADLSGALLRGTDLSEANLKGANLKGATVSAEQLATVKSLEGAIMPDGTKHA